LQAKGAAGVSAIARLLTHRQAGIRQAASDFLGRMGARAKAALPSLSQRLQDSSPLVRRATAENLGRITRHDASLPGLVPYLLRALHGENDAERVAASVQLGQFRNLPADSVVALQKALKHPRLQHFQEPLLGAIAATRSEEGIAALLARLGAARSQSERDIVVTALGSAGAVAVPAVSARSGQARDPDQLISLAAVLAIQKQARAETIVKRLLPTLRAGLASPDSAAAWRMDQRRIAARRLAVVMRFSAEARSLGLQEIDNIDPHIRAILISALGHSATPAVLPRLAEAAQTQDEMIKAHAMAASARIRARHPSAHQRWQQCLDERPDFDEGIERCRHI
jgi:HEAT repeat protein